MIWTSSLAFICITLLLLFTSCNPVALDTPEKGDTRQETDRQPVTEEIKPAVSGCQVDPKQRQDIAILPDARIESATANFITYQTNHDIDQAVQFYQDQMAQHGWSANEGNVVEADLANLVYTKAGDVAMLMIHQKAGSNTKVVISINNTEAKVGCGKAGS
jgi:hypothetical protein